METDRHGYCEHNRRDHKCWECQAQRARAAELRVAELEGEREYDKRHITSLQERVHGAFDARDSALTRVQGLEISSRQLSNELTDLQAQLDRANGRIEIMHTLRSRMQEQLDRATEPRAYGMEHAQPDVLGYSLIRRARSLGHVSPDELDDLERFYAALDWFAEQVKSTKPRPMSEAPRDGTWVLVAVQVRPDKHRWRTAHWDSKLGYWIEGGRKVLRGLREPVAWQPQALVPTSSGGGDAT